MRCRVFQLTQELPTFNYIEIQQALNSIKRYPLPLNSGQEAKVLENIGK